MLSVAEAIERLIAGAPSQAQRESVPVLQALGRVLAEPVLAEVDVPPADNSAMDGYAFNWAEAEALDFCLPVSQRIPAGTAPQALAKGTAARIFTGSELPAGADTVAMQEKCQREGDSVTVRCDNPQDNVRYRGQDIRSGETLLHPGTRIRPQEMGLLSSIGVDEMQVYRKLRVVIFSTGDELVEPGSPLQQGQIYNSNRATLTGLVQAMGMELVDLGTVADNFDQTVAMLAKAAKSGDVIISAGGVSVGEEDHVKTAVEKLGEIDFWRIAIKPGKPLAFGTVEGTPFIGLPGNPASVFATFMVLARPYLLACQGVTGRFVAATDTVAQFAKKGELREVYLRGKLTQAGVEIYPNQSSGVLSSASWGDVLVQQPPGQDISIGDRVKVLPYATLLAGS